MSKPAKKTTKEKPAEVNAGTTTPAEKALEAQSPTRQRYFVSGPGHKAEPILAYSAKQAAEIKSAEWGIHTDKLNVTMPATGTIRQPSSPMTPPRPSAYPSKKAAEVSVPDSIKKAAAGVMEDAIKRGWVTVDSEAHKLLLMMKPAPASVPDNVTARTRVAVYKNAATLAGFLVCDNQEYLLGGSLHVGKVLRNLYQQKYTPKAIAAALWTLVQGGYCFDGDGAFNVLSKDGGFRFVTAREVEKGCVALSVTNKEETEQVGVLFLKE